MQARDFVSKELQAKLKHLLELGQQYHTAFLVILELILA